MTGAVWRAVRKVVDEFEAGQQSKIPKNQSYQTLKKHHSQPLLLARVQFFQDISVIVIVLVIKLKYNNIHKCIKILLQ